MTARKTSSRQRRAARGRQLCVRDNKIRLVAHRSGAHIYAQIVTPTAEVLVAASSVEKEVRKKHKHGNTVAAATAVGERLAAKAKQAKIDLAVTFDRSGFKYHGRIKALAEAARSAGLEF